MASERRHRLVIADDHTILREGLKALMGARPDLEVVGEATDGREAVRCAEELKPDLMMLDLSMPRSNGLEALKEIKRVSPGTKVLVLTVHKTEDYVFTALQAGADGYVLKDSSASELTLAVRSVLNGERYLAPAIASTVVMGYLGAKDPTAMRPSFDELTTREREVLKLIAEGYRTKDIAEYLCISPKTVEKHRANLMDRLNLRTVSSLTTYAIEKGLVTK
ncbi:response regulator transcription factor [Geothrix sp. PMB-07]|uniref:response regulator n=1 Tax=Geothrix sp. PMB-07 TaxID=3068640 RepID=UPI00274173B8|nr:response regulator transcription factor [Geothrix sp. PMB-07]WLT32293.1 response regulator transcription factor [Geothrix sp. PMB-07]